MTFILGKHGLAQELSPELQVQANEIFQAVKSPFCPGRLLQDCPSSDASKLKADIRARLAAGESEDQILEYLYGVYGDGLRSSPQLRGFGVAAWLAPPVFLILGGLLIILWIQKQHTESGSQEHQATLSKELEERIERELEE